MLRILTHCSSILVHPSENQTHSTISVPIPGEILNTYWQNDTCSPFTSSIASCDLGNRVPYSINVTGPDDVRAGVEFARRKNIRLVIRNTGIDYLGQSTGYGALALWTNNLKSTKMIHNYSSTYHTGPAMRLGSGITAGEAYQAVQVTGHRLVTAECGLTGVAGGYVQAGGQSQLVTAYGLAADQVLEWEVVTLDGRHLIATPDHHADLYWALAGGGGGTYAVVLSVTFRVFPEGPVAGGAMTVTSKNSTALFKAIELFFHQAPSFVNDTHDNIQLFVTNDSLAILNIVMPDQNTTSSVDNLLAGFLPELDKLGLLYNLTKTVYPSYLNSFISFYGPLPYGTLCPTFPIIGSRLVPRTVVQDPQANHDLIDLYRNITSDGTWWIGCSILNVDDRPGSSRPPHPPNSVLPAWRNAIAYCNPQTHTPYPFTDPAQARALRRKLIEDIFPRLEAATPGGGNLNEIDPTYKGDWKEGFYGENYERLLEIKHNAPVRVTDASAPARVTEISAADRVAEISLISVIRQLRSFLYEEQRVHEFVIRRFLACCSKDAQGSKTDVSILCGPETFNTSGPVILERNYLGVYIYNRWSNQELSQFTEGEVFEPTEVILSEVKTSPPGYLTEPDLLVLMDANGIGNDATMADHIATITDRQYVEARAQPRQARHSNDNEESEGLRVQGRDENGLGGRTEAHLSRRGESLH
ncbi:FAD-dependent isoamyl alcohol oxidase [Pyrenophora tritici-repentis]|nr:FAD-dependent isoamyl alcohol oxidase [Pyrenophora tritici-repentis]